jgi:tetratricopeptide (TPR) repeat protein
MANVGLSYAVGELGMSAQARQASDRAQRLERSISPLEQLMIELRTLQLDASALPNQAAPQIAYKKKLDDAIASFPDDVELLLLVGQAQDSTHDDHGMSVGSASLPFYLKALAQSPDDFATHHLLSHAYENLKQFDQALVHAKRYAELADAVPHAHHMYGHVLRRLNRMTEAIAEFERADQLEVAYLRSESIPPRFDWHYRHNLSLLGSSYQYVGRVASAEAAFRRSSEIDSVTPTEIDLDRQQLVTLLLARQDPLAALTAARSLTARPQTIEQALGHVLAGRALLALKRPEDAAGEGNLALARMRAAGPSGGMLVPEYELLQGEFLLRTGQGDNGRAMLRSAAAKLHDASGPDAWVMTLFSLEAIVRAAGELGDWPLARDFTGKMRELDATYPGTEYALGMLAERDGQRDVALGHYQKAVGGWSAADRDFPPRLDAQAGINRLRR